MNLFYVFKKYIVASNGSYLETKLKQLKKKKKNDLNFLYVWTEK